MDTKNQLQGAGMGETGTHVIAQAESEHCQEFCPSSMKPDLPQGNKRLRPKRSREGAPGQEGYSGTLWRKQVRAAPELEEFGGVSAERSYNPSFSDLYSSTGGSPALALSIDSAYIYASSLHACATSCSGEPQEFESYSLGRRRCDLFTGPAKDWPGCSVEAVFGSDPSCDGESDSSFDSSDNLYDLNYSSAEAEWGSASSRAASSASGYTIVYGSDTSHSGSHFGRSKEASYDLYDSLTLSSDTDLCGNDSSDFACFKDEPERAHNKLHGVVMQTERCEFSSFFNEMMKDAAHQERTNTNEGFLFHPQKFLQTKNSEYREGREYSFLQHIQNGSYGDVYSVRDKQTGFTCAAKRIPLSSFSWEEVGTWSKLDSPHVLQLFGAVREGLNVVLFMDLKTGSVAQLLKESGSLSEHVALYYHRQVLLALKHLHSKSVIHLDVKVDNVLLSMDMRQCFLCDFGLSEMLDQTGYCTKTFRGNGLRGTESHMSPEVAHGDPRSGKADIWSSCCMLLHMLSGHQPWTRYYTHPLCLKIVSEPAPLWEIPPGCGVLTCDVIRGGLVKEPRDRDSARQLLEKSTRALQAVAGPCYQVLSPLQVSPPLRLQDVPSTTPSSSVEESSSLSMEWVSRWREQAAEEEGTDSDWSDSLQESDEAWAILRRARGDVTCCLEYGDVTNSKMQSEDYDDDDDGDQSDLNSLRIFVSDWMEDELEPLHRLQILFGPKHQRRPYEQSDEDEEWSDSEEECITSTTSANTNSRLTLTCHRSVCSSEPDPTDKDSVCSEDWSSGVFSSCSSLTDEQSFNVDWSVSTNQPPSCCFEGLGVDIWVEDVSRDTFRIRERLRVKLGHVAMGISAQVSMRAFTLATVDGKPVSPDSEVLESGVWLLCVPAPDGVSSWSWRIKDGKMETQEPDGQQSDTCSTLEA